MKAPPKILLALTGVAALSLAYPAKVQAVPTKYHYTGHHFTEKEPPYTTDMFVTGMVMLAGPLGANMPLTDVTPTAWTFFDGVQTISSTTPDITFQMFSFATNARGEINFWLVEVGVGESSIVTFHGGPGRTDDFGNNLFGFGSNLDTPGVWTRGHATPDAGSTLSLMTLTLMALVLVARRFQRAAG